MTAVTLFGGTYISLMTLIFVGPAFVTFHKLAKTSHELGTRFFCFRFGILYVIQLRVRVCQTAVLLQLRPKS